MINEDAALGHDLFEIAVRNWKTNVKINGVKDHRFWVLRTLEIDPLVQPDVGLAEADLIDCNCLAAMTAKNFATLPSNILNLPTHMVSSVPSTRG